MKRAQEWLAAMLLVTVGVPDTAVAEEDIDSRIGRIESRLPVVEKDGQRLAYTLDQWMRVLRVPGVSIAVIDDYRIVWSKGYGTVSAEGAVAIEPDTLFQAASIAKPVAALVALRQVELGKLDLDADINDALKSWTLPSKPDDPAVTLRQLLAHTAGVTPGGFAGYERDTALPNTLQILRGEAPASNRPALRESPPDKSVAYSGLGYTIIEVALEDALGESFASISNRTVLAPLNMHDSLFAADLPAKLETRAAHGHRLSGKPIADGWTANPELAAAGLWSTPTDLARLMIAVAESKMGRSQLILDTELVRQMLATHRDHMGIGFVVRPAEHGTFAHSGGNQGYRAHMEMQADTGQGVVVMTNADAGHLLISLILRSVASEYTWATQPKPISDATIDAIIAQVESAASVRTPVEVDAAILARYAGRYELASDMVFVVSLDDGTLYVRLGDQPRFPVHAESESRFFFDVVDAQITFEHTDAGDVTALVLHQGGRDQRAPRLPANQ